MSVLSLLRPREIPLRRAMARSAVALIERQDEKGEPALLFIQRASREGDPWSGDMAFPGGKMQVEDSEPREAAIRETLEETGLDLQEHGRLVARLSDRLTRQHSRWRPMVVTPYLFAWHGAMAPPPTAALSHEVEAAVWVPRRVLASPEYRAIRPFPTPFGTLKLPCCIYQGHCIWGLSFSLVNEYLREHA